MKVQMFSGFTSIALETTQGRNQDMSQKGTKIASLKEMMMALTQKSWMHMDLRWYLSVTPVVRPMSSG